MSALEYVDQLQSDYNQAMDSLVAARDKANDALPGLRDVYGVELLSGCNMSYAQCLATCANEPSAEASSCELSCGSQVTSCRATIDVKVASDIKLIE